MKLAMNEEKELTLVEIEQQYPHQWVLVEETVWDKRGVPLRGIVRAYSETRGDLNTPLQELHKQARVKTFVFYTGELVPKDMTVVL
jgi:hypothetical protein